jgi:hypothetical protein
MSCPGTASQGAARRAAGGDKGHGSLTADAPLSPAMRHVQTVHETLQCLYRITDCRGALPEQLGEGSPMYEGVTPQCSQMVAAVQRACLAAQDGAAFDGQIIGSFFFG